MDGLLRFRRTCLTGVAYALIGPGRVNRRHPVGRSDVAAVYKERVGLPKVPADELNRPKQGIPFVLPREIG